MTTQLTNVFWYDIKKEKLHIRDIMCFMMAAYRLYFLEAVARYPHNWVKQIQVVDLRPGYDDRMDLSILSQFLFRVLSRFETDRLYYQSATIYVRIVYFSAVRFSAGNVSPACFTVELAYPPPPVRYIKERASSIDDWTIMPSV
jgi:hypothetical protein